METLSEEEWEVNKSKWQQNYEGEGGYTEKEDRQRHCVKYGTCQEQCEEVEDPNSPDPFGGTMWVCKQNPHQSSLWIHDDALSGVPCPEDP